MPSLDASPEQSAESHRDRENKKQNKTVVVWPRSLFLSTQMAQGLSHLVVKIIIITFTFVLYGEMATSESPLKNPSWRTLFLRCRLSPEAVATLALARYLPGSRADMSVRG